MANKIEKPENTTTEENGMDVNVFFSDPKHAKEAGFMRNAIKHIFAELASEEEVERKKQEDETKSKNPPSFLDQIFGFKK